jgi:hypothetical protein
MLWQRDSQIPRTFVRQVQESAAYVGFVVNDEDTNNLTEWRLCQQIDLIVLLLPD